MTLSFWVCTFSSLVACLLAVTSARRHYINPRHHHHETFYQPWWEIVHYFFFKLKSFSRYVCTNLKFESLIMYDELRYEWVEKIAGRIGYYNMWNECEDGEFFKNFTWKCFKSIYSFILIFIEILFELSFASLHLFWILYSTNSH